jgi:hypothetical protein
MLQTREESTASPAVIMRASRVPNRAALLISGVTFAWLAVYFPLETYITWSIAGVRGLLYSSYIANVAGMCLLLWGGIAMRRSRPAGPGLLAAGWAWTAATFWRATSDRFWLSSLGMPLYAGPVELWLAPILTALAVAGLAASLALLLSASRSPGAGPEPP